MRGSICDARLPIGQCIEDDLCSTCSHEVRMALGMGDPLEELVNTLDEEKEF